MNNLLKTFAATALVLGVVGTAQAGMISITSPDAAYQAGTTLIPITEPDFTNINSLTDGSVTISFSSALNTRTVPTGGWATWSSAPDAETSTPRVAATNGVASVTFTFSQALDIFGIEIEPDPFSVFTITAEFFNGATSLGTISRDVDGNAGARLFAADATDGDAFTSVTVSMIDGFAIANARYAVAEVPVPATVALFSAALAGLGFARTRRTA